MNPVLITIKFQNTAINNVSDCLETEVINQVSENTLDIVNNQIWVNFKEVV